jgi:zinc/manganese transport system substrate-binding protein
MKSILSCVLLLSLAATAASPADAAEKKTPAKPILKVVTTLPDYKTIVEFIGGDRVSVRAIVRGDQDAHFIRPKPSFVTALSKADLVVATGLDLELWLPTVVDKSGNTRIRSGQPGYVAAAQGMKLLEKPKVLSHVEGGVHIHGNPHVTCSPLQIRVAAGNIAQGLIKNDAKGKAQYLKRLKAFRGELDRRLFGAKLVKMLGGDTLCKLAEQNKLIPFLKARKYKGKPLIDYLGGWMKKMLPLRGTRIVTYHKNWVYFLRLFGLQEVGTVEPKPGIPPSPKHVTGLIKLMREQQIKIIMAANYFDEQKVKTVAGKVGARAVMVPVYVGGVPGVDDYFKLVDYWVDHLLAAAAQKKTTAKPAKE